MDKVYQVFVSSTFSDLKDERLQVSNTLSKAGYVAAGMELFPATDQQQLEYIKRVIDRSDYYVVIVGGRYGSLADDTTSFTEKEFDYARSRGIPVLAFLHGNSGQIAVSKTDDDRAKAALLERFREKLSTGRIVEFWTESADLCTKVVIAVANAVNLTPGVGWIRGDQAIDPKVLQETERLRLENEKLLARLSAVDTTGLDFDPWFLGPDDTVDIPINLVAIGKTQAVSNTKTIRATYGEIFSLLYDTLVKEPSEGEVEAELEQSFNVFEFDPLKLTVDIDPDQFRQLRNQFEAMDLIRLTTRQHVREGTGFFGSQEWTSFHWQVTDKGRNYAVKKRALRKDDAPPASQ